MPQKPTVLAREIVASSRLFRVEEVQLRFSNGAERTYERLVGKGSGYGAVMVVAMLDAEHFFDQFLQTVPVGISADKPRRDFGAEQRCRDNIQIMRNGCQIESGIMKQLETFRIGKNGTQIGCFIVTVSAKTDQMFVPAAIGNLQKAQPVAWGNQPHGFRVNRHDCAKVQPIGQVVFVKVNGHEVRPIIRVASGLAPPAPWVNVDKP